MLERRVVVRVTAGAVVRMVYPACPQGVDCPDALGVEADRVAANNLVGGFNLTRRGVDDLTAV